MRLLKWTLALQTIFLVPGLWPRVRVNGNAFVLLDVLWLPVFISWLALLLSSFFPPQRSFWRRNLAVLAFGPLGFFLIQPIAEQIKPNLFQRDFPKLESLLAQAQAGFMHGKDMQEIEVIEPMPKSASPVFKIWIEGNAKNPQVVTFFVSTARRIDAAYVYCPQKSDLPKVKADWPRIYERATGWHEVEGAWWDHDRFKAKEKAAKAK